MVWLRRFRLHCATARQVRVAGAMVGGMAPRSLKYWEKGVSGWWPGVSGQRPDRPVFDPTLNPALAELIRVNKA